MARNEEKAQSMLNRWLAYKQDLRKSNRPPPQKRPALPTECSTVQDCERWRMQIIRDLSKKVSEIQNESLGEQRIRDLNDELNKLLREKGHWERRILELGGPNYMKVDRIGDDALVTNIEASEGEHRGYSVKYFGAAKKLPEVKEKFQKKNSAPKRQRVDPFKGIDAEYYGYRDDEDPILEKAEQEAENRGLEEAMKEWEKKHKSNKSNGKESLPKHFDEKVPVPSKEDMEKLVIKKRKEELLKKYVSEGLSIDLEKQKVDVESVTVIQ